METETAVSHSTIPLHNVKLINPKSHKTISFFLFPTKTQFIQNHFLYPHKSLYKSHNLQRRRKKIPFRMI